MNDIEGKISIDLYPQTLNGCRVEIQSSRPVLASKVLIGKTPQQALELIPLMFNICGNAQARTAVAAIHDSLGQAGDNRIETARDMLVLAENAREHMFRVFVDWPKLFNLEVDSQSLHPLGSLIGQFRQALFIDGKPFTLDSQLQVDIKATNSAIDCIEHQLNHYIFHCSSERWLAIRDIDDFNIWVENCHSVAAQSIQAIRERGWANQGSSHCPNLPDFNSGELSRRLNAEDADHFIANPMWQDQHHESTPLSRQAQHPLLISLVTEYDHALLPRWIARLVELATIPAQLRAMLDNLQQDSPEENPSVPQHGLAFSEAARGRLVHRVQIANNNISNYQILAPTEWNFHPEGLIRQSLSRLQHDDPAQLEHLARLMINSIDPCVGYDLTIHAENSSDA